jgi:hypothetical protein
VAKSSTLAAWSRLSRSSLLMVRYRSDNELVTDVKLGGPKRGSDQITRN